MNSIAKLILIDTETTGLDAERNGIIQIAGSVRVGGKEVDSFNWQIAPLPNDVIEPGALAVNGHTAEIIKTWPNPAQVKKEFESLLAKHCNKFDKSDKFHWVGYNADFDMRFVRAWFSKLGDSYFGSWFWFPPLDVMSMAAWCLQGERHRLPNFKLGTVADHLGLKPAGDLHDAMADINLTWEIRNALLARRASA